MKVTIEKGELVIRIAMTEPTLSKSEKSMIIASTHGFAKTGVQHPKTKNEISVSINAITKPAN